MARAWYINGRFLTQPVTGVQRYAREVVRALERHLADGHPLARELEVEIIAPPSAARPSGLREIQFRTAGFGGGQLWEQAVLPQLVRGGGGLVSLGNTGPLVLRKQIVCIHDATTRTCQASYSRAFRTVYRVLHPALGRTAARIATVSGYAAGCLAEHGICNMAKIAVAANGHEHALNWIPSHSAATRAVAGPNTVVIVGSLAPHKNIGIILGMATELEEAGLRVAVTGLSNPRVFSGLPAVPQSASISWLGRLSDSELAALLRDSLCLAFPSLEEGFGLPALEAMALQCPVVVSNRASLPEVCGDAALYASPFDREAWLETFLRLRNDARLRQQMIARGRLQALRYRWARTAETYLEEMARLDGVPVAAAEAPASGGGKMTVVEHAA
ncbi:MAG TPA: glycosyltransferase family 1 protein [Hyphomicrobiaceae bacterium]|nr:glycosyltransferase family 1 protein [Hyphomicrobiaceae bacterium]